MNYKFYLIVFLTFILGSQISYSQTADAGADQEVCTNVTVLNAVPPTVGYTGTWTVVGGFCVINDVTAYNTSVSNLNNGFNELMWTITNGIITDDDNVIIINNDPTQAITASDQVICQNSYVLNTNPLGSGETGLWSLVGGSGTLLSPTLNSTSVTGLAFGENTFAWTITKGICNSYDEILITNHEIHANAGIDQIICEDFSTLAANDPAPGIGTWSVIASSGTIVFGNLNSFSSSISGLGINTNSIQWSVSYSICSDYDNVVITSNKPTTANAGIDKIICNNNTILSANNPSYGIGEWSVISGNGSFVNINNYNSQVNTVDPGNNVYDWTITYNGCSSSDQVNIFYDYFISDAGADDVTCTDSYTLNANDPSPGIGEWRVTGGSGNFTDINLYNTEVHNLIVGINTFEWKITKGACIQTDYVSITRNTASTAYAGADIETCNSTAVLSADEPTSGSGTWSLIAGGGSFTNPTLYNTGVTSVSLGANTYRWTVDYIGCANFDDVIVTNNYVSSDAGPDFTVCGTDAVLSGNIPGVGETGLWTILAGTSQLTNSYLYNTAVSNMSFGLNKFRWTIKKGICTSIDVVDITNDLYPATASVSGSSDICDDVASILGNMPPSGGTGTWSVISGGGIFDNSHDQSTFVRSLALGENIIHWTIQNNTCFHSADITINRNTVFSDAGINQIVCSSSAVLAATPPEIGQTGIWTQGGGTGTIQTASAFNSVVTNLASGLNSFIWTISENACSDQDIVEISNNTFFTSAGTNQTICTSTTPLNATSPLPGTGYWEVISGFGTFNNITLYNTTVSNLPEHSSNIFRWNVTKNGCSAFGDVTIKNNFVSSNAGTDIAVCSSSTNLAATAAVSGTGVWTVQAGSGIFANANSPSTLVNNVGLNLNTYRWTITNGLCSDYDDVTVTNNFITAYAGEDQDLCFDYTQLSGQEPPVGGSGLWEIVLGYADFNNTSLYNAQITNILFGLNTFKWTLTRNGCSSSADEVMINNNAFIADAGPDQALEPFITSTDLNAFLPVGASGEWLMVGGGGLVDNMYDPNTLVTGIPSGVNQFLWTVFSNGCLSDDVVNITVINFTPNAGNDRIICDDHVVLNAYDFTSAVQFWSLIQGTGDFDNPSVYNTTVRNISLGTNIYRWTVTMDGATNYDDVSVTRIYADAGEDQLLCTNTVTLTGNIPPAGCSGLWSIISGAGTILNPTSYNTDVQNIDFLNNVYEWSVFTPECVLSDYVDIYNDQVIADAGDDQNIESTDTFLDAVLPVNTDVQLWTVISGTGNFYDETNPKTYVSDLTEGENVFRWTISNSNCSDFDEVTITSTEIIIINIDDIETEFNIYPNPVDNFFHIETEDNLSYSIKIIDVTGKTFYSEKNINESKKYIDISILPAGIYIIKITYHTLERTYKLIKK